MSNQSAKSESRNIKKRNSFLDYFSNLKSIVNNEEDKDIDILENLKKAHYEWEKSQQYFESVTDPDLIDHAIHNMEAAKIKYYYLLKEARKTKQNNGN